MSRTVLENSSEVVFQHQYFERILAFRLQVEPLTGPRGGQE